MEFGVTLVGAGSVGSFTILTLTKMGIVDIAIYDPDHITSQNIPNQFYTAYDIGRAKVIAIQDMLRNFAGVYAEQFNIHYSQEPLKSIVIVATDSMASRRTVWEQFKKQPSCRYYIEARMGGELGIVYCIQKSIRGDSLLLLDKDIKFYEDTLYSDEQVKSLSCTARTIIYNVLMIASLIGKTVATLANNNTNPREQIFDMQHIHKSSFMIRS